MNLYSLIVILTPILMVICLWQLSALLNMVNDLENRIHNLQLDMEVRMNSLERSREIYDELRKLNQKTTEENNN